jgi:hypothetical protein
LREESRDEEKRCDEPLGMTATSLPVRQATPPGSLTVGKEVR